MGSLSCPYTVWLAGRVCVGGVVAVCHVRSWILGIVVVNGSVIVIPETVTGSVTVIGEVVVEEGE